MQRHNGAGFDVSVKILGQETQVTALKTSEVFWIHARSPEMKMKDECLQMTQKLSSCFNLLFWSSVDH